MAIFADGKILMCHHKCGTSFALRAIQSRHEDFHMVDKDRRHMPMSALPEEYRSLPIYGLCRNPWSFYVSRWHQRTREYGEKRSFEKCLHEDLYSRPGSTFGNVPEDSGYSSFLNEVGSFTAFHVIYHSKNVSECRTISEVSIDATIMQLETISSDISKIWGVPNNMLNQWKNAGSYGDWRSFYTEGTAAMVAESDKWLIERYGYTFK